MYYSNVVLVYDILFKGDESDIIPVKCTRQKQQRLPKNCTLLG